MVLVTTINRFIAQASGTLVEVEKGYTCFDRKQLGLLGIYPTGIWNRHLEQAFGTGIWNRHLEQAFGTGIWNRHLEQAFGKHAFGKHAFG
jgi:hypothetical protein